MLQKLREDVYQVVWEDPLDNGGKIELYWLEGKQGDGGQRAKREANFTAFNDHQNIDNDWVVFYNGTGKKKINQLCFNIYEDV